MQLEGEPAFAWRKDEGQREGILRQVQGIDTATKHRDMGKEFPEVPSGLRIVSSFAFPLYSSVLAFLTCSHSYIPFK